MQRSKRSRK